MTTDRKQQAEAYGNGFVFRDDQARLDLKNGFIAGFEACEREMRAEIELLRAKLEWGRVGRFR